ncbi:MAG: DUF4194 domain-containing protein, partial [Clostridia bacterium]
MTWEEQYEALSAYQKGEFTRLANYLVEHTFVYRFLYDTTQECSLINQDYMTLCRLFDLMEAYFEVLRWELKKDERYDVIHLYNPKASNSLHMDKFTTLFLYALRIIYEEKREEVGAQAIVTTTTNQVIEKMQTLGVLDKQSTGAARETAQKTLVRHNILVRMEGSWSNQGNTLLILPSILHALPPDEIYMMYQQLTELSEGAPSAEDEDE